MAGTLTLSCRVGLPICGSYLGLYGGFTLWLYDPFGVLVGVRIKFKPVDNPTTDRRIFGCHPLCFIGGVAKFPDKVMCRTADKKTRSAWRLYLSTLPVEHFTLDIVALRGAEIRLPLECGLDLQLMGNMMTVLYNPQRCYLHIGKPRTRVLPPSHLPPTKKRRLGDPEDEQAVRSALALWRACTTHALPPTLQEERETYQAYLREHEKLRPLGDPTPPPAITGDSRGGLFFPLSFFSLSPFLISRQLAMEGGGDGGGNGDGGRRRTKKTICRRQAGEGPSGAAYEDPPAVPMEEDTTAAVPGEDEPVGPKKRVREVASKATSDEDYFRAYARRYGAQVYKGSRRPFDPEGRIASLEGILHSTIR
ncbi:hypothetical protein Taro_014218 [Colocasia esculenta]|uniref:Uncharacterized protein n=1 Tax=Colocasia esculenta TaxID=4460 RepID=A0A843U8I5_COLES|nr:hypothetical protein [Colocasia esculenta]